MIRVVMLGPAPEVKGGVSSYVRGLMDAGLAQRVSLRFIPTLSGEKKARKLLAAAGGYIRFLFALTRCDAVHAHMASRASYRRKAVFVSTARLFGKKIVLHMHGGEFDRFYRDECDAGQQARIRRTLARADVVIALSDSWRAFYAALVDPARVVALPNAVFVPAKACEKNRGTDIVFLGKLCPQKGVDTLARAFARIADRLPDACLWLCGDGDPAFVDALGLDPSVRGRIRLPGWLAPEARDALLDLAAVFAFPSQAEGMPMALLEAMAHGCAVIATPVGGIPQAIESEKNGLLVPVDDVLALAEGLWRLLSDEPFRRRLGEAARETVEEKFSMDRALDALCALYQPEEGA